MYTLAYNIPTAPWTDSEPRVYGIFHGLGAVQDFLIRWGIKYCHVQIFSIDRGIIDFSWEDGKVISTDMSIDTLKEIDKNMTIK